MKSGQAQQLPLCLYRMKTTSTNDGHNQLLLPPSRCHTPVTQQHQVTSPNIDQVQSIVSFASPQSASPLVISTEKVYSQQEGSEEEEREELQRQLHQTPSSSEKNSEQDPAFMKWQHIQEVQKQLVHMDHIIMESARKGMYIIFNAKFESER